MLVNYLFQKNLFKFRNNLLWNEKLTKPTIKKDEPITKSPNYMWKKIVYFLNIKEGPLL